jgi:uncharacterized protein (TIGR03437 family)
MDKRLVRLLGSVIFLGLAGSSHLLAQAKPVIAAIGNAASYSQASVSPGEMVVLFGTNLGPVQLASLQVDSNNRLATSLAGVQIFFNGLPASLMYVSQTQSAAMVPFGVSGDAVLVNVSYMGIVSDPVTKALAATAPGIFSSDASGSGQAAATNADGSFNSTFNPARPGKFVTFYLTGTGQTSPPGMDGTIANGAANLIQPVTVTIGGHFAQVLYAGAAPENVNGFSQINAVVPVDLPSGGNFPLLVQVGNNLSQAGLILVVAPPLTPSLAAPTNLQATATSPTTGTLTWVNNAPTATAIRLEVRAGLSNIFQDIGAAPSLSSTNVTGLQPNTPYAFRVRAQQGSLLSDYSNLAGFFTPPQALPKTVVIIHGIGQGSSDMAVLNRSLSDPVYGLDATRFKIDSTFNWRRCAGRMLIGPCPLDCSIEEGATELANYILNSVPSGQHVILVGYSMGGLLARDMRTRLNFWS